MNTDNLQTEIETSVMVLGAGYAATLISMIFWLAA
ncbi:MAG: hypothetical protein BMS9Abin32_252 [Gammaproteobacteria bacterium]|nr:MAG: hypothetical protein BMS9Abin32_252 [Gammaproteobacteria bacterium]